MAQISAQLGEGAAFNTAGYVLRLARAAIADNIENQDGDLLTDDWPQSYDYLNIAYRSIQHELADNGIEANVKQTDLLNVTATASSDPETQVFISQNGYFDGENNHENPKLPADMIIPLRLYERFSGTQNPFVQVQPAVDGIPVGLPISQNFRYWDFRTDAIYMPGATQDNDLRLRYVAYFPELTDANSVVHYRRIAVALAYMTAYVFSQPRGNEEAGSLLSRAQQEIDNIVTQTTRKKQRRGSRRKPYGGRGGWSGYSIF